MVDAVVSALAMFIASHVRLGDEAVGKGVRGRWVCGCLAACLPCPSFVPWPSVPVQRQRGLMYAVMLCVLNVV